MKHFLVFGTHPRLSLAEFKAMRPLTEPPVTIGSAALVDDPDWDGAFCMNQSGGIVKLGDIVESIALDDLSPEMLDAIIERTKDRTSYDFGYTMIGATKAANRRFVNLPIQLKKLLRNRGLKSRWVTTKGGAPLSPAAVAKLGLTTKGFDFVLVVEQGTVHIGLTTHVQNADAWSLRDYGRPIRDDEAGMLPPKLARMMVNLGRINDGDTLLDPFCGSGTVLMEAGLSTAATSIIGSDVSEKQINSSQKNMEWCMSQGILKESDGKRFRYITSDIKNLAKHINEKTIDVIVTEGHLGPLLKGGESQAALDKNRKDIENLWRDALRSLRPLLRPHARLVIVWPSFKTDRGLARVGIDPELTELGYRIMNPLEGWDESNDPLIYHRPLQRIARRIVLLEKL